MPRQLKVAAVQMNAEPAPKGDRLARAADLIAEAAAAGAQLIVLPEVFNTGYEYSDNNYALPEPIDGETVTWMKDMARQHNAHISGSLLLLDGRDVYNSQILVAPDGRRWRYDKNYPWAFERAYFRDGTDEMIADTDLGKLGMMICWDYSHPEMWQRYAGKVDAMVITSCPPTVNQFQLVMPNNQKVDSRSLGPVFNRSFYGESPFGPDLDAQLGWMGVPGVNTTGAGEFHTHLPRPRLAALVYLAFRPDLWRFIRRGSEIQMVGSYYNETKVVNADGTVQSHVAEGEGFTLGVVDLADETPAEPTQPQPEIPYSSAAYFFSDYYAPALMEALYRKGIRRQWGNKMAPFQRSIRWSIVLGLGALGLVAALIQWVGRLVGGKNKA